MGVRFVYGFWPDDSEPFSRYERTHTSVLATTVEATRSKLATDRDAGSGIAPVLLLFDVNIRYLENVDGILSYSETPKRVFSVLSADRRSDLLQDLIAGLDTGVNQFIPPSLKPSDRADIHTDLLHNISERLNFQNTAFYDMDQAFKGFSKALEMCSRSYKEKHKQISDKFLNKAGILSSWTGIGTGPTIVSHDTFNTNYILKIQSKLSTDPEFFNIKECYTTTLEYEQSFCNILRDIFIQQQMENNGNTDSNYPAVKAALDAFLDALSNKLRMSISQSLYGQDKTDKPIGEELIAKANKTIVRCSMYSRLLALNSCFKPIIDATNKLSSKCKTITANIKKISMNNAPDDVCSEFNDIHDVHMKEFEEEVNTQLFNSKDNNSTTIWNIKSLLTKSFNLKGGSASDMTLEGHLESFTASNFGESVLDSYIRVLNGALTILDRYNIMDRTFANETNINNIEMGAGMTFNFVKKWCQERARFCDFELDTITLTGTPSFSSETKVTNPADKLDVKPLLHIREPRYEDAQKTARYNSLPSHESRLLELLHDPSISENIVFERTHKRHSCTPAASKHTGILDDRMRESVILKLFFSKLRKAEIQKSKSQTVLDFGQLKLIPRNLVVEISSTRKSKKSRGWSNKTRTTIMVVTSLILVMIIALIIYRECYYKPSGAGSS